LYALIDEKADQDDLDELATTIGDEDSGLVKDVAGLQTAVGNAAEYEEVEDESTGETSTVLKTPATGLYALIDNKASQIEVDTHTIRIGTLEEQIDGLSGAMHFVGVKSEVPTTGLSDYNNGDVIVVGEKEYVFSNGTFIEFGDVSAEGNRISALETAVGSAESEKTVEDEITGETSTVKIPASGLYALIDAKANTGDLDTLSTKIGEIPEDTDVASMIGNLSREIGDPKSTDEDGNPIASTGLHALIDDLSEEVGNPAVTDNEGNIITSSTGLYALIDAKPDHEDLDVLATTLGDEIGDPKVTDAEGNVTKAATGIYALIDANQTEINNLSSEIGDAAVYETDETTGETTLKTASTGIYALVDEKADQDDVDEIKTEIGKATHTDGNGDTVASTGIYALIDAKADQTEVGTPAYIDENHVLVHSTGIYALIDNLSEEIGDSAVTDEDGNVITPSTGLYELIDEKADQDDVDEIKTEIGETAHTDADGEPVASTGLYALIDAKANQDDFNNLSLEVGDPTTYKIVEVTDEETGETTTETVVDKEATGLYALIDAKPDHDDLDELATNIGEEIGEAAVTDDEGNVTKASTGLYALIDENKTGLANLSDEVGNAAEYETVEDESTGETSTVLKTPASGLYSLIDEKADQDDLDELATTVGNEDSGLVADVSALKTTVGSSSSGLVQDVTDLKTTVGNAAVYETVEDETTGETSTVLKTASTGLHALIDEKAALSYVADQVDVLKTKIEEYIKELTILGSLISFTKGDGTTGSFNTTWVGTRAEYDTAYAANQIPVGTIVVITDEEDDDITSGGDIPSGDIPSGDKTSSILGTGVLGYMVLG